ncbi:MAG: hypothetical protein C0601_11415 [Candidatus Muiribacterium halophilum]|uniref:PPM-type phosphatase domain-containing protein n=1 Tax=Muiribacterium halophilum TaxID=2053465 RepID=A0A2N5ZC34_MUIH1|nr:MAG: hypothetical protein C0601_11415 [Candidatus Muirbacterium halophilum]
MNKNVFKEFSIEDWIKLVDINKAIVSELQLDKVLILILKNALDSIQAESGSLMLVSDDDKKVLKIVASVGIPKNISENTTVELGEGISGTVAETGKSILIEDIEKNPKFKKKNNDRYKTKSCIAVPLIFKKNIIGVFNINNKKDLQPFIKKDVMFSETLAQQAAIAIQNARLYRNLKEEKEKIGELNQELEESLMALSSYTEELYTFHDFTKNIFDKVVNYFDFEELVREIARLFISVETMTPSYVVLYFKEKDYRCIIDKNGVKTNTSLEKISVIDKISNYCIDNNESIRIPFEENRYNDLQKITTDHFSSVLCVPLFGKEGPFGTIMLLNSKRKKYQFDEKTRNLMSIFSLQVSTALSLFIALDEIMKKRVLENELKVASKIQKMFMPGKNPIIPGLEIAHVYIPTFQVGGDYIDFLWHDDQRISIALGDVAGKGVPAALIMALTKSAVKSNVSRYDSAKGLLDKINTELISEIEGHRFVTMIYSIYDWKTRTLRMAKAGHNPPLIFKKNGEILRINPQGLFLGMFRDCILKEENHIIDKDDIVVFYTDGVEDAVNEKGENFGLDRLKATIWENLDMTPEELKDLVVKKIRDFSGNAPQADDISIIIGKGVEYNNREIELKNHKAEINRLFNYLTKLLANSGIEGEDILFKVRLIVDEALCNAIEHGNRLDEKKTIKVTHELKGKKLILTIEDDGDGFEWKRKLLSENSVDIKSDRGRGIIILKELCDEFVYNSKGNNAKILISLENK